MIKLQVRGIKEPKSIEFYHHDPNWYKGLDYPKERERGYYSSEDLLVPGYLEMPITKGQSIIFTASLREKEPALLKPLMEEEMAKAAPHDSLYHCLVHAAHQFRVQKEGEEYILAGYPWFKSRARDLFISERTLYRRMKALGIDDNTI